jgi:hypothetical protein
VEGGAPRKPNWTLQAILCVGVVAWRSYDPATAGEARPTALLARQYLALAGGLIGVVGAPVMMARSASPRG